MAQDIELAKQKAASYSIASDTLVLGDRRTSSPATTLVIKIAQLTTQQPSCPENLHIQSSFAFIKPILNEDGFDHGS